MDLRLIYLLAGEDQNICMILDNDQSIYAFRGARIEAVMNMRNVFNGMKTHLLNINYRSTQTIVNASRSLIDKNEVLIEKQLRSNNEEGNPIVVFDEKDAKSEAARIVKLIKLCTEKQAYGFKYKDIAILYRMNYLSREIEEALLKYRIPYKIVGGVNFYSRKEIKDVMSYFRFIINPSDVSAFERAINTPKRGIGEKSIEKIINYSSENGCTLLEAIPNVVKSGKAKQNSEKFIEIINELSESMEIDTPNESILKALELTKYIDYLYETEKKGVAEERIENLKELSEVALNYESIIDLSNNITLDSTIVEEEDQDDCVQLLTMHSSKGLEWNVVIIAGAVEGITPSYRAKTVEEYSEERRLFYVAATRAKKMLFITRPNFTVKQGNYIRTTKSRFIEEIDEQYIYEYAQ